MSFKDNFNVVCHNLDDTITIQNILFENGYKWRSFDGIIEFNSVNIPLLFNIYNNIITWSSYDKGYIYSGVIYNIDNINNFIRKLKLNKLSDESR